MQFQSLPRGGKKIGEIRYLVGGTVNQYQQLSSGIRKAEIESFQSNIPVSSASVGALNPAFFNRDPSLFKPAVIFSQYSSKGFIAEQQKTNDVKTSYLWGYNGAYPVAQIVGADYNTISGFVNQSVLDNVSAQYSDEQVRNELNKIRTGLANSGIKALVTTYTFKPWAGMTSVTDATGKTMYYEYDGFGRVDNIRDQNKNILKKFQYKYSATVAKPVFTASALNTVLSGFQRMRSGELNHTFATSVGITGGQKFFTDTRDMYRDGVAKLPEQYRTQNPGFYTAFNLNLSDPYVNYATDPSRLCFMQNGYSVEWSLKMPPTPYNNNTAVANDYVFFVSTNYDFGAIFTDRYGAGANNGTYLYGYHDFDGNSGGAHNGGGMFSYIKISDDHLFNAFHSYKLEVTSSAYNVYVDGVLIYTHTKNPATIIDSRLYLDAGFLGNDGAVDYVKVFDSQHADPQFDEEFNNPVDPVKLSSSLICPNITDCRSAFVSYFNSRMSMLYTSFDDIAKLYLETTGEVLNVCN